MSSVFPTSDYHHACVKSEGCRVDPGLTLRDYFAAQFVASGGVSMTNPDEYIAFRAYRLADAMMKARSVHNEAP